MESREIKNDLKENEQPYKFPIQPYKFAWILSITPRNYITCFAVSSGTAEGFILGAKKAHFLHMYTHSTTALLPF